MNVRIWIGLTLSFFAVRNSLFAPRFSVTVIPSENLSSSYAVIPTEVAAATERRDLLFVPSS